MNSKGWAYCPVCGDGIPPEIGYWHSSTGDTRFCGWECLGAHPDHDPNG